MSSDCDEEEDREQRKQADEAKNERATTQETIQHEPYSKHSTASATPEACSRASTRPRPAPCAGSSTSAATRDASESPNDYEDHQRDQGHLQRPAQGSPRARLEGARAHEAIRGYRDALHLVCRPVRASRACCPPAVTQAAGIPLWATKV